MAKTIKKKDKSAGFPVQYELVGSNWKWRAICRNKFIGDQRRSFETKAEAIDHALQWFSESTRRKAKKLEIQKDPKELEKYAIAQSRIDNFNVKEWDEENKINGLRGETTWKGLDVEKCVDVAVEMVKFIQEMNSKQDGHNLSLYNATTSLRMRLQESLRVKDRKQFQYAIDSFMRFKKSKTGGKGRRPLSKDSLREWVFHIENLLSSWIGERKIGELKDLKYERNLIRKNIDSKDGWGQSTKKKCAQKIKEFGGWMAKPDNGLVKVNPFEDLPSEYDYKKESKKTYYENSDVEELFNIACSDVKKYPYCFANLIPYLSLVFFAGIRPSEAAKDESSRRFNWKDFNLKEPFNKTKGIPVFVHADKSKISFDRRAELAKNGLDWIQWWADEFHDGKIPEDGDIFYSKRTLQRLKKEWGKWKPDAARHTYSSCAREAWLDQGIETSYWSERTGHSEATFKRYYSIAPSEKDAKSYFSIKPKV